MKQSEKKWLANLGLVPRIKWYKKLEFWYIEYPLLSDVLLCTISVVINNFVVNFLGTYIWVTTESLNDLSNELVSTSIASGGFVLAALAIVASIKEGVKNIEPGQSASSGKEFFYNSPVYGTVLKIYSISCLIFVVLFVYFTIIRSASAMIDSNILGNLIIAGVIILVSSFIRCIWILWMLIRLK